MELKDITPEKIEKMDYNELIAIVRETNRPPGGSKVINEILIHSFMSDKSKILDVGTSTGFTSLEIAKLINAEIIGIDINELALKEARERAKKYGFHNLKFLKADVTNMPFKKGYFDMVFCGNVTSIIPNRKKAFEEYKRVTKKWGFLAAVPMYYVKEPPNELIKRVSDAIHVNIKPLFKKDWIDFFKDPEYELFFMKDYLFDKKTDKEVNNFVDEILKRPHLRELPEDTFNLLKKKYRDYMMLFRDNLSYMGFSILLLRKKDKEIDPELFTSTEI